MISSKKCEMQTWLTFCLSHLPNELSPWFLNQKLGWFLRCLGFFQVFFSRICSCMLNNELAHSDLELIQSETILDNFDCNAVVCWWIKRVLTGSWSNKTIITQTQIAAKSPPNHAKHRIYVQFCSILKILVFLYCSLYMPVMTCQNDQISFWLHKPKVS